MLLAVRLVPLLMLLPLVAGHTPEPARDKRNLHHLFRGLADAFGYDIRLKNATAGGTGLPPPSPTTATTPLSYTPKVTEETTQGYTGTTATDSELVPPFKFQGERSESDSEIFDGARPTENYRPRTASSDYHGEDGGSSESKEVPRGEQEERSNRPADSDGPNKEFSGYPSNFGSPYKSSYEGYPPSFHGNDPYYGSSSECRGCSETEEQKNEKIFTNTDEHSAHVPPPYSTPNWEGFWDAAGSQGKDTHVGYNDYRNTPTESVQQHTEAVFPREEENYVTSKEDTYENLKYKQSKQTAPSHSGFRITEEAYSRGTELPRPTLNDRGNSTQSASEDILHTTLPTHEHSVHGRVYSEQLPVISTFKPKLLHALEEVEGSKQNVYVPPPFDDSFESTDSLSLSKSPKVLSTTPVAYSSTSARNAETSLADISQHLASQDKVSAHASGSISPWHPSEEHFKPKESQEKKYHPDDPHYPRPFTYTQAIFHDQPSNNKIVNTSETSISTTPHSSTNAYLALFVPLDSAESKESLDTTTKSADGYLENSRNRKSDYSSPHSSAYRYNNDYEKPLADRASTYSFSPAYTQSKFYKNRGNDSVTKDSVPQNSSSSNNFVAHRPQNYSAFPPFSYSELERTPSRSHTPEHSTSDEYSAPNNPHLARTQHQSNQHPDNYTQTPYPRLENSSHVKPRELGSANKYDGTASELVSASKHPLESPHQSESNSQTTKSDTLPTVSTVESSTIHSSHSDKYSKLETFSSEVPNESSSSKNSSEPYKENLKTESNLNHLDSSQQSNSPNVSDPSSRVSEHHKVPSGSPYQFHDNEPIYHYSKLSIPPSVIPLHYPYEESVNYPKKGKPPFGYHGESNKQFPSYTSPDRVPSASGFKDSEKYYIPSPSKVYDPYVYSEDFHRPNWEKLNDYYFSHHPEATNNTHIARTIPQHSYFESSLYPNLESYSGPRKITLGSGHEKPPQGATTARQSQPDEASRDGKRAEGAGEESRATARDGSQSQQQVTAKGHLQRHPSFSADNPGQLPASSEVLYEDQTARTSAPSREELHYSSQTIPPPTAYQPLESLEHTKFWEQDERRPENLKVTEWESSVSTLSVMSTSTSYPETARKKSS